MAQDLKVVLRIDGETGKVRYEVDKLEKKLKETGASGKKSGEDISKGMDKATKSTKNTNRQVQEFKQNLLVLASLGFAVKLTKDFVRIADNMKLLDARIKLVTDSQREYNLAQEETIRIALETHTSLEDTVNLYTRLERSLKTQGSTQEDVLQITQTINEAFAVSGATAIEASNAIRQLTQSFSANRLSGDEFRSVSEQGSRIMQVLQVELGKTAGELKKMAEAGELTTKVITDALLGQSQAISDEFAQLPVTVDKALVDLRTKFGIYAKSVDAGVDITGKLSGAIVYLSKNLDEIFDTLSRVAIAVAVFKGAKGIAGLIPLLKTQTTVMKTATVGSILYGEAMAVTTIKTTALSRATKGLTAFLKANPIGVAVTAGFLAFEYFDNIIDEHNDKLDSLTFKYEDVENAMSSVFDLIAQDKKPQALIAINKAIDEQTSKLKILETELSKVGEDNFFRQRDGTAVLSRVDIELIKEATKSIELEKQAIKELEQVRELAKQTGTEFAQSVSKVGEAYQFAGRLINIFGDILPNVTSNQELLNIATSENFEIVSKWLESADKQLEKLKAKNEAFGKTTTQIILDTAAAKKKLTTDKKLRAEIDKTTKALIKQVKINETNIENKKAEAIADKERLKLISETLTLIENFGTETEKLAIIEKNRLDELARFPEHQDAVNKKYDEQIISITGVKTATKELNKEKDRLIELNNQEMDFIDSGNQNYLDFLSNLEFEESLLRLTTFEREKAILSRQLEAQGIHATNEELERSIKLRGTEKGFQDGDTFSGLLQQGETFATIFETAGEGFEGSLENSVNSMNVLLQGAQFLNDIWQSTAGKDDAGRVLDSISQIAATGALGPVAQAIAQVAQTIDSLTGGKLFGTSYEVQSTALNFDLANGGGGGTTTTEVRDRSLFRGRQWRDTFDALTGDALSAIQQIAEQRDLIAHQTATALGTTAAELVNATFEQVYDAEGNLISSKSVIDGVTYNDATVEEFASRVYSEQIIAGLVGSLPKIEREIETFFNVFDDDIGEGFGRVFGGISRTTTQMVDEVDFLAETFRTQGVDALAEFSEFALRAVVDIKDGSELLGSLTDTLALIQDLQAPGESLSDTYVKASQSLLVMEESMSIMGITTDQTREELIRSTVAMSDFAGGLQEFAGLWETFFTEFYSPEELLQQSISSQSELLGQQATDLGIDPSITEAQFRAEFEARLAAGTLTDEQTILWLEFAGALSRVNNLLEEQNAIEQERLDLLLEASNQYNDFSLSLKRQLDDINGVDNSLNDLSEQYQNNIDTLNDLAIASGKAGAADRDLANAHALYVAQIRQATQALFDQLYGDDLDSRIAELEASQVSGFNNVSQASNNLFEQWERAIDNLRDYTNSRLVSAFSPLEADEQLDIALAQFNEAFLAAQGGDLEAANSLAGLANVVDGLNQAVNTSGSDYNAIFFEIQDALNSLTMPDGLGSTVGGGGSSGGGISPELQALYDERDARLDEQTANNRLELATALAQHLEALASAVNQPLFDIADEIGLNMRDLVTDLGVNLDALTVASVENLADISNLLGVSLSELATNLGEDVSLAMGVLADDQSLLNDALENTIAGLPDGIENSLTGLLNDVETAADGTAQEVALLALEEATAALPVEYRNQLAPYFDNIDPISELQEQLTIGYRQIDILDGIKNNLAAQNTAQGFPSYAVGTSYVPNDGLANIHEGEKIIDAKSSDILSKYGIKVSGTSNKNVEVLLSKLNSSIAQVNNGLRELNLTSDTISDNTGKIDDNIGNIQIEQPKRTLCSGGI